MVLLLWLASLASGSKMATYQRVSGTEELDGNSTEKHASVERVCVLVDSPEWNDDRDRAVAQWTCGLFVPCFLWDNVVRYRNNKDASVRNYVRYSRNVMLVQCMCCMFLCVAAFAGWMAWVV
jgi:hypothetical protein